MIPCRGYFSIMRLPKDLLEGLLERGENLSVTCHYKEHALLLTHVSLLLQAMRLRQYQVHPGWRKDQLDTLPGEYHVRYERLISRRCACDRCLLSLVQCVTA